MELDELQQRLGPFCRAMYEDDCVEIEEVWLMPGTHRTSMLQCNMSA